MKRAIARNLIALAAVATLAAVPEWLGAQIRPVPVPATQISMHFRDAPVDEVLQCICRAKGYVLIEAVDDKQEITLWNDEPMSPDKGLALLNSLLKDQGYALVLERNRLTLMSVDAVADTVYQQTVEEALAKLNIEQKYGIKVK